MNLEISENKVFMTIFNNEYKFPLEWIIFGSKTSTDIDIMVILPMNVVDAIGKRHNIYTSFYRRMDGNLLPHIQNMAVWNNKNLDEYILHNGEIKPVNTSCGNIQDGVLIWSVKGSVGESNNSILATFKNHPQMFSECPIFRKLDRDIDAKILSSLRMVVGCLARSEYTQNDKTRLTNLLKMCFVGLVRHCIKIVESARRKLNTNDFVMLLLTVPNVNRTLYNIIKENGDESVLNSCDQLSRIVGKKQNPIGVYKIRKELVLAIVEKNIERIFNLVDGYMEYYQEIEEHSQVILEYINNNIETPNFGQYRDDVISGRNSLGNIASFVLKINRCGYTVHFLETIEWRDIDLVRETTEKMKKICFQIGQTLALLNGVELFDKEGIAGMFPELRSFLMRKEFGTDELNGVKSVMHKLLIEIKNRLYDENLPLNYNTGEKWKF